VGGENAVRVMPNVQAQCSMDFQTAAHGFRRIRVNPDPVKPYRFLPFTPGHSAFIDLTNDQGAQLVLTGPLSGCSVFVARDGGRTIFMHLNGEADQEGGADPARHWQLATATLRAANMPNGHITNGTVQQAIGQLTGYTAYGDRATFVVGCKPRFGVSLKMQSWTGSLGADDWRFYVYGYGDDRLFAEI
jgi:hypothetical protein